MRAVRLNAYLARAGVASRRRADELIRAGRVRVNGEPGELNTVVGDARRRRGRRRARRAPAARVRPAAQARRRRHDGERPARTPDGRRARPAEPRVVPVGRLDVGHDRRAPADERRRRSRTASRIPATASRRCTRPRSRARPARRRSPRFATASSSRTGARRRPRCACSAAGTSLELTLHEGRKHQVKRMCEAVGHPVRRLHRSRYAGLDLDGLEPGSGGAGAELDARRDRCAPTRGSASSGATLEAARSPSARTSPRASAPTPRAPSRRRRARSRWSSAGSSRISRYRSWNGSRSVMTGSADLLLERRRSLGRRSATGRPRSTRPWRRS